MGANLRTKGQRSLGTLLLFATIAQLELTFNSQLTLQMGLDMVLCRVLCIFMVIEFVSCFCNLSSQCTTSPVCCFYLILIPVFLFSDDLYDGIILFNIAINRRAAH